MSTTCNFSDEYSSPPPTQSSSYPPLPPSPNPPLSPLQSPPSSINRSQSNPTSSLAAPPPLSKSKSEYVPKSGIISYPTLSSSLAAPPPLSKSKSEYVPRSGTIVKSNKLNANAVAFYPEEYQQFPEEVYFDPLIYDEHEVYQEPFAPPVFLQQNIRFARETGVDYNPNHTLINEEEVEICREMSALLDSATHEQEQEFYENSVDSNGYIPQKVRFANQTGLDYIPEHTLMDENEEIEIVQKMNELFDSVNNNSITYEQYALMWEEALQIAKKQNSFNF